MDALLLLEKTSKNVVNEEKITMNMENRLLLILTCTLLLPIMQTTVLKGGFTVQPHEEKT